LTSRLFKTSIALIVVGVALMVILQVLYVPKVEALQRDSLNYSRNWPNNAHVNPPTPEDYGLDVNTMFLVIALGNIAYILLILGVAFLVVLMIAWFVKRTRGYDAAKPSSETP
jgi:high-affinity Fe2+/Pb2+ permease